MGFKIVSGGTPDEFPIGNVDYYINDFESGEFTADVASPFLKIVASTATLNGGLIGDGNMWHVTGDEHYTGSSSLRFDYAGRNNYFDNCGDSGNIFQKTGHSGVSYFISSTGTNLVTTYGAAVGRTVVNVTNGWSVWQIASIESVNATNDKLNLTLIDDPIASQSQTAQFNAGDSVRILRVCCVDGNFNIDPCRMNDGDINITYFRWSDNTFDLSTVGFQSNRESIFRRIYVKGIGLWTGYHQKFHYWGFSGGGGGGIILYFDGAVAPIKPRVALTEPDGSGGFINHDYSPGSGLPSGLSLDDDTWYYIEEEFKPESADGAADGEYRLWYSVAGSESETPILNLTGKKVTAASNISFWGNFQHSVAMYGAIYIDDFRITNYKMGAIV